MPKTKKKGKASDTINLVILSSILSVIFIAGVFILTEVKMHYLIQDIYLSSRINYVGHKADKEIDNFDDCLKSGALVMESYPRQCLLSGGQLFIEELDQGFVDSTMIKVEEPLPATFVSSPLSISGQARGTWFFEGDFPIVLFNDQGDELSSAIATSQGEWMTEDFVDFEVELEFDSQESSSGFIVFYKSNPSGLEENDDSYTVPVFFEK